MVIKLSPEVEREVSDTIKDFGYKTEREFIEDALRRRILELKKIEFLSKIKKVKEVMKIKEVMKKRGIIEEEILEDFNKFTHK